MFKFHSIFTSLLALLVFTACDPEENITPENDFSEEFPTEVPELPLKEMYLMPVSLFSQEGIDTNSNGKRVSGVNSYQHFAHGATQFIAYHTPIALYSAVPTAALALAANEEPVPIEEGYEWSYQYATLAGKTYDVVLRANFVWNPDVAGFNKTAFQWRMYLSEQGGFQDFEWFSGFVSQDLTLAQFNVFLNPSSANPVVVIDYERSTYGNFFNRQTDGISLSYTVTDPDDSFNTEAFLEYNTIDSTGTGYNANFLLRGEILEAPIDIQLNTDTGEGRVRDEAKFGDNEWKCWNKEFRDEDC